MVKMNARKSTITTAVMFPGFCNTIFFSSSIATPFPPPHSPPTLTVNPRQPPPPFIAFGLGRGWNSGFNNQSFLGKLTHTPFFFPPPPPPHKKETKIRPNIAMI